eukprot:Awhi_evm4s12155
MSSPSSNPKILKDEKYIKLSPEQKKRKQDLNTRRRKLQRVFEANYEGKFSLRNKHHVEIAEKLLKEQEEYYNETPEEIKVKKGTKPKEQPRLKPEIEENRELLGNVLLKLTQHKSRVNHVLKLMNKNVFNSTINDLMDVNKVSSLIDNKHPEENRHNYYQSIVKLFSLLEAQLTQEQLKVYYQYVNNNNFYKNIKESKKYDGKTRKDITDVKPKTSLEKLNWVDHDKLLDLMNDEPDFKSSMNELIAALYIYLPVERSEMKSLRLTHKFQDPTQSYKDNKKVERRYNWIVMKDNEPDKIVLNEFKTKQGYKQLVINLKKYDEVKQIIEQYIDDNDVKEGEYLFAPRVRNSWGNQVGNSMKQLSGKFINEKLARIIYVNGLYEKPRNYKEIIRDAIQIGHQVSTEINEYLRK